MALTSPAWSLPTFPLLSTAQEHHLSSVQDLQQFLPELCWRCACLQTCLLDGPSTYIVLSLSPGWTLVKYIAASSSSPVSGPISFLLLFGVPVRTLGLVHHLSCLGLLMDPVTSTWFCPLWSDPAGLCLIGEGTACTGITLGSWFACSQ